MQIPPLTIKSVAGVATISPDPVSSLAFFAGLGISFQAEDDGYNYTTGLEASSTSASGPSRTPL